MSKKSRISIIIIITVCCLVCGAILSYFLFFKDNSKARARKIVNTVQNDLLSVMNGKYGVKESKNLSEIESDESILIDTLVSSTGFYQEDGKTPAVVNGELGAELGDIVRPICFASVILEQKNFKVGKNYDIDAKYPLMNSDDFLTEKITTNVNIKDKNTIVITSYCEGGQDNGSGKQIAYCYQLVETTISYDFKTKLYSITASENRIEKRMVGESEEKIEDLVLIVTLIKDNNIGSYKSDFEYLSYSSYENGDIALAYDNDTDKSFGGYVTNANSKIKKMFLAYKNINRVSTNPLTLSETLAKEKRENITKAYNAKKYMENFEGLIF